MLPDPFGDRKAKNLPMPPNKPMDFEQLFSNIKGSKFIPFLRKFYQPI
jgi:hypothetical protein